MREVDYIGAIMRDKKRASLGDAYINLAYSLSLTQVRGEPKGVKVSDRILADALKEAGLRKHLGSRHSRKDLANASEALLMEAYRSGLLTMEESVNIISHEDNPVVGIANLLKLVAERLELTGET
jgi:hypothetical protein